MAAINDLVNQIQDEDLKARILKELNNITKQKKFGLVFENHIPESTPLYDMPVKRGTRVKRRDNKGDDSTYVVLNIEDGQVVCTKTDNQELQYTFSISDLVRIAEFGEPIYPYLKPLDSICNAPDSGLWHTLIEAENYHALQLLDYLYAGKVDCIYIDPPYNTGAKDWKYNNDYVGQDDQYRHSKWLAFMERRLKLAKQLLNPKDSVMIVTIDEKEYTRLGMLLEQVFPEARIQMITSMTNKKGQPRDGVFSRCEEYIFYVFIGDAKIARTTENMLFADTFSGGSKAKPKLPTIWNSLLRRGTGAARADVPTLFYPIFVDEANETIVDIGDPLPLTTDRNTVVPPNGAFATWPMHKDGTEGRWQMKPDTLRKYLSDGTAKLGKKDKNSGMWSIVYLKRKQLQQVASGEIVNEGRDEKGALILHYPDVHDESSSALLQEPRSLWVKDSHDASVYGSTLIKGIVPNNNFTFPKSLYAVQDSLRFIVKDKPNALIIDFFAGSGTTLHAVNLLNAEDNGNRRCIIVTNNEVSDEEAKILDSRGLAPGDEEWEALGIAKYVTWPRTVCSIKGQDINGNPLKGNYYESDIPMAKGFSANAVFFKLGFLDSTAVSLGMSFTEMLPLFWMKSGAIGRCPKLQVNELPNMFILPENHFAILVNEQSFALFEEEISKYPEIQTVFIATDYEVNYRSMIKNLNVNNTFQLYRDYLDHFRLNRGRS